MIEKVVTTFKKHKIQFAVCGGYAVVLHGVIRGTMDLDVLVNLSAKHLEKVENALKELGFVSRIPVTAKDVAAFRKEYVENRNLVAWSFYHPTFHTQVVDILITHDVNEFDVQTKHLGELKVPVLSIDSLIKLKKEADRPQDRSDIEALKVIKRNKRENE